MVQFRRKQQQRVTLVGICAVVSSALFATIILLQLDSFPHRQKHLLRKQTAIVSPETRLAQEFLRNQQQQQKQKQSASEPGARRFAMILKNLVGGESGRVVFETRPSWAPLGVAQFHELIGANFYNDCRFFRVLTNFMVQFGINGDPTKQSEWRTRVLQDDPVKQTNARGTITYAMSGNNTRTTQLFINTNTHGNKYLDKEGFAPVAIVLEGMEFVDQIYSGFKELPVQGKIVNQGNEYLNAEFPNLSFIE
jgi:peptidyl-prolyl cis-trans isomerase A (cyclophilin A)